MALDFQTYTEIQVINDRLSNNKYKVLIPDCPDAGKMSDLSVRATRVDIPLNERVNVNEIVINGFVNRKATGDTIHPSDCRITFIDDQKLSVRNRFKQWKEFCASTNTGTMGTSGTDYKRDIEVLIYNDSGDYVCSYILPQAFPISFNTMGLESTTNPRPMELEVSFSIARTPYRKESN